MTPMSLHPASKHITLDFRELNIFKSDPRAHIEPPQSGDAGIDLRCIEDIFIPPFQADNETHVCMDDDGNIQIYGSKPYPEWIARIRTGIHMEIPVGWFGRVAPRSSIGAGKQVSPDSIPNPMGGTTLLAEIIDSSYRGEIIVALANLTNKPQVFASGTKVAQLILQRHAIIESFNFVESLSKLSHTDRGEGGFGSTGIK